MTINQAIKNLQKLGKQHGMRTIICADTQTLRDSCNDTWNIVDISDMKVELIELCDGDGCWKFNKDGTQAYRKCLVLR